jgi:molecular chaperone HtpG
VTPAEQAERGTALRIQLKADAGEFASTWRLESIVRKHSDYVSFPIYVKGKEGEYKVANRRTALWRQSPSSVEAAQYVEFYKQLAFDDQEPLLHAHLVADAPANVRSILYVPSRRERNRLGLRPDYGLHLYSRKILIQNHNKDLLPEYLRFVEGVVDSEDLPLNVSRETVQSNPITRQLRKALTNRVLKELKGLAEREPAQYERFWGEFGQFLKEGVVMEMGSQETLVELLRFRSTRTGEEGWVAARDYVARLQPDQQAVYYILGPNLKSLARSPHLDYFRKHDIEVLLLTDSIDGFFVSALHEMEGKPLQNVDDANLKLPEEPPAADAPAAAEDEFAGLLARAQQVLGENVREVRASHTLVDSPARLVTPEDDTARNLQLFRRLTEENYQAEPKILELNRRHPIVVDLARQVAVGGNAALVDAAIGQLFDNLLLLDGLFSGSVADLVERVQLLLAEALRGGNN